MPLVQGGKSICFGPAYATVSSWRAIGCDLPVGWLSSTGTAKIKLVVTDNEATAMALRVDDVERILPLMKDTFK
jgi:hypothetical protein